jgi:uncharacterized protein with HEPN domain
MSERDVRLFFHDIFECIEKIESYIAGYDFNAFRASDKTIDAIIRNLEIIGEAATHIPEEIQVRHQSIPWKKMRAFRNIVAHEYFGVELRIIWRTAKSSLPGLKKKLRKIYELEFGPSHPLSV